MIEVSHGNHAAMNWYIQFIDLANENYYLFLLQRRQTREE